MKAKILIIITGIVLIASLLTISSSIIAKNSDHFKKKVSFTNPVNQQIYNKWLSRIGQVGGQEAYLEFKTETGKKAVKLRHNDAHLFGEALYQVEGLDGVSVCDNSFSYGCYHSFLGSAIYSQGLEVVQKLSNKCFEGLGKDGFACQHGIGHGVLSSVGYDLESVNKSLKVCSNLKDKDLIGGCPGGVFMEYNFQTMLLDDGKIRAFDENDPYFPCSSIGKASTGACIYQQAQWWLSSIKTATKQKIEQIDLLCSKLPSEHLKVQCFKGFGINLIAYINYDIDQAKSICDSLTARQAQIICRSGASISLLAIPHLKEAGREFCTDPSLNKSEQDLCKLQTDQIKTSPIKNQ